MPREVPLPPMSDTRSLRAKAGTRLEQSQFRIPGQRGHATEIQHMEKKIPIITVEVEEGSIASATTGNDDQQGGGSCLE